MFGFVFATFIALFIAVAGLCFYFAAKRRKALMAWAASRGLTFSPAKDRQMDRRFGGFECLRLGRSRYARNIMEGEWSGRQMTAFDYSYVTGSGKNSTRHVFSAVILASNIPLKPLFIRPENFLDKITAFVGLDDIDFESAEFSRRFYVKADDKRWAYDVIHARTMEFLLDVPGMKFSIEFSGHLVMA
ncbi:MAG: hypothetical protein QF662_06975, partial [Phycisphaerae bacterium]|nr:hypothetical protein [Phycisphaerae bacterium]